MKVESHLDALAEYFDYIEKARDKLPSSRRTLLILCSQASAEIVAILLHKIGVLDVSTIVKHNKLNNEKWWDKLPAFQNKTEIADLAKKIESARNLSYGTLKEVDETFVLNLIKLFFELKQKTEELTNEKLEL